MMTIDKVTIQSVDGEGRLVLSGAERDSQGQPDYAIATFVMNGMLARTRIYLRKSISLINLFEELAAAGQGWKGEKYAETLEGELRLKCTWDNLGRSAVEVSLVSSQNYWVAKGILLVENRLCEMIVRDLKEFFNLAVAGAN